MRDAFLIIIMVAAAWIVAELMKFFVNFFIKKKPNPGIFLAYGGFPSAHSALVSSLVCSIFIVDGLTVPFIISMVLALIVIRDTITIRENIDKNSRYILQLSNNRIKINLISHSVIEIIAGILIGILVPLFIYLFI
jgi:acid phosphatase family membrane protein YuiD